MRVIIFYYYNTLRFICIKYKGNTWVSATEISPAILLYVERLLLYNIMTYTRYTCEPYRFSNDNIFNKMWTIWEYYCFTNINVILTRKIILLAYGRKNRYDSHTGFVCWRSVNCTMDIILFYCRLNRVLLYIFFLSRLQTFLLSSV